LTIKQNLDCASSKDGNNDGDNVDSELELEEFGDAVVDVSTPHDSFDNGAEVIVRQNDVRRFFCHICASDTL
jgi:hypothetical protein